MELAALLAGLQAQHVPLRCPKCNASLVASVTTIVNVPLEAEVWTQPSPVAQVLRTGRVHDTKKAIQQFVAHEYEGSRVDDRDDIYCANYGLPEHGGGGCDFHSSAAELERQLLDALARAKRD